MNKMMNDKGNKKKKIKRGGYLQSLRVSPEEPLLWFKYSWHSWFLPPFDFLGFGIVFVVRVSPHKGESTFIL